MDKKQALLENLCWACFFEKGSAETCPACGYSETGSNEDWNRLIPGTLIHGRYAVGRTLGQGGFGITYLSFDLLLETKLAIKEYYPSGLAARNSTTRTVLHASEDAREDFRKGLEKFLEEAKVLARFEGHPNIVTVKDFFEENGTAYMVMGYLEGSTLLRYLENSDEGRIPFEEAMTILAPVMDALDEIHASGIIHRDISPDNIFLTQSGQVKLLDFGASKTALAILQRRTHSVVLKRGYSPSEQYQTRGNLGPWTDVYGMAATLYRALTGKLPPDAIDRMAEDLIESPAGLGVRIPFFADAAIIKAMSIQPEKRPQSMREFKEQLLNILPEEFPQEDNANEIKTPGKNEPSVNYTENLKESPSNKKTPYPLIFSSLFILAGLVFFFIFLKKNVQIVQKHEVLPAQTLQSPAPGKDEEAPNIKQAAEKSGSENGVISAHIGNEEQAAQSGEEKVLEKAAKDVKDAPNEPTELTARKEIISEEIDKAKNEDAPKSDGGEQHETIKKEAAKAEDAKPDDPKFTYTETLETQKLLKQLGFEVGSLDGVYGTKTEAAIRAFQKNSKLKPDGLISRQLIADLKKAEKLRKEQEEKQAAAKGPARADQQAEKKQEDKKQEEKKVTEAATKTAQKPQAVPRVSQTEAKFQYEMGVYYKNRDPKKSYTSLLIAAENGHVDAQVRLGDLFMHANITIDGESVSPNYSKGAYWYEKAAKQSNVEAQYKIGWAYEFGFGVTMNRLKAVEWYRKAAENNNREAMFRLGYLYSKAAYGVPDDERESLKWYIESARRGYKRAKDYLKAKKIKY